MLVPLPTTLPLLPLPFVPPPVVATSQLVASSNPVHSIPTAVQALVNADSAVKLSLGGILLVLLLGAGVNAWRAGGVARARAGGIPSSAFPLLLLCIAIDIVSDASYLAATPRIGFLQDLVWGPVSALALTQAFGSKVIGGTQLVKELASLDFLPVATVAWLLRWAFPGSNASKDLGITHNVTTRGDK
jgi:hypothetical protein